MNPPRFNRHQYRGRLTPVRNVSTTLRKFFELVDERGIPATEYGSQTSVTNWRKGRSCPTLLTFEEICTKTGYRIVLERIEDDG